MIDTHAHVNLEDFGNDRSDVLDRAWSTGVGAVINVGIDRETSEESCRLAESDPRIYATVGQHPNSSSGRPSLSWVGEMAVHPRVVAIGETGLDFYRDHATPGDQEESFRKHVEIAAEVALPLVIHVRQAEDRVLDILEEEGGGSIRGAWHCFSGTSEHLHRALNLGLHIGIGGVVTFKNSHLRDIVPLIPAGRLLLETDCPFLAPHPLRGKRNEPSYLTWIRDEIAKARDETPEEVERHTGEAATKLFALDT